VFSFFKKVAADKRAMDEEKLLEPSKKDQEKMERMTQQMTIKRKTSEIVFLQLVEDVKPVLEIDCATVALKKAQEGLDAALADCKEANDKYLELLDKNTTDAEFNWKKDIQMEYNANNIKNCSYYCKTTGKRKESRVNEQK
jgi:hypothetical protein